MFKDCVGLKSFHIPKGLKSFSEKILDGCTSLESLTIDEENEMFSIKDNVLYSKDGNKLIYYPKGLIKSNFIIPEEVEEVEKKALATSEIKSVQMNNKMNEIE